MPADREGEGGGQQKGRSSWMESVFLACHLGGHSVTCLPQVNGLFDVSLIKCENDCRVIFRASIHMPRTKTARRRNRPRGGRNVSDPSFLPPPPNHLFCPLALAGEACNKQRQKKRQEEKRLSPRFSHFVVGGGFHRQKEAFLTHLLSKCAKRANPALWQFVGFGSFGPPPHPPSPPRRRRSSLFGNGFGGWSGAGGWEKELKITGKPPPPLLLQG